MAFPLLPIAAGTVAAGAYLNGKYHIVKDLKTMRQLRTAQKRFDEAKARGDINIHRSLRQHTINHPTAEAIWTPTRRYTYLELYQHSLRWAQHFRGLGVERGEFVAFFMHNSAEFMFAWLGLLLIHAAPAMVNYNLRGKALVHCVKVAGSKIVLADAELVGWVEEVRAELGEGLRVLAVDEVAVEVERLPVKSVPEEAVMLNNPVALRYTSGTTGFPKAVRTLLSRTYTFVYGKFSELGLKAAPNADRWYVCMPLCHATAGSLAMASIVMGVNLCLVKRFSVSNFWDEVRLSEATLIVYVGEIARYLLTNPPSPLDKQHNVRLMYGNGLRPDVWKAFRDRFGIAEIAEMFGSTEGVITFVNVSKGDFLAESIAHHGLMLRRRYQNLYAPVAIDYETGEVVRDPQTGFVVRNPYSTGGEIIVNVPDKSTFIGYYNNPDATNKRFLTDVFEKGDLWYRCGDALKRDDDGKWYFMDRLGDTFRWRSENVSTAEVSEALGRFPGVVDANVVGVKVPGHEGRAGLAALLVEGSRASFDIDGLLRHAQKDLPKYAIPTFLRFVNEPAMNNTHKQSKVSIREEGADPARTDGDPVYFLQGDAYIPFEKRHWDDITDSRLKL